MYLALKNQIKRGVAIGLLVNTDLPIEEISTKLGFRKLAHLRVFLRSGQVFPQVHIVNINSCILICSLATLTTNKREEL